MTTHLLERPLITGEQTARIPGAGLSQITAADLARITGELTRRGFLGGTGAAAAGLALAACGSAGTPAAAGHHASYPVRIDGKFGPTVIPAPPARVVAIGQEPDVDAVAELGVNPVGAAADTSAASGIEPWTQHRLGRRHPELLNMTAGPPLEKIAALHPDLIIATTYYNLAMYHSQLSKIAPVLSYVTGPNTDTWQTTTRRAGLALGRQKQASQVVTAAEADITGDRRSHPAFDGRTFTFGPVEANGQIYTTSSPDDLSAALLAQLGLALSPKVTALPPSSTPGKSIVSPEQIDLLDADVLILTYISDSARKTLEASPLFRQLPAVRRGAYIALPLTAAVAMAFPSALSIEYALGIIVPLLAKALR